MNPKKWFLKIGLCICVCVEIFSSLYLKTNNNRNTKFYTQYQISVLIIFSGFGENRKMVFHESWAERTVNEIGSEFLRKSFNHFFQIWYINTFLHAFKNVLVLYYRKNLWKSKFGSLILAFGRGSFNKNGCNDFFKTRYITSF